MRRACLQREREERRANCGRRRGRRARRRRSRGRPLAVAAPRSPSFLSLPHPRPSELIQVHPDSLTLEAVHLADLAPALPLPSLLLPSPHPPACRHRSIRFHHLARPVNSHTLLATSLCSPLDCTLRRDLHRIARAANLARRRRSHLITSPSSRPSPPRAPTAIMVQTVPTFKLSNGAEFPLLGFGAFALPLRLHSPLGDPRG